MLNYEVVLASGAIVQANARENNDLWLALGGGGNNFGVVTRFDMRTFKQGPIFGGSIYYAGTSFHTQETPLTHFMISLGFAGALSPEPLGLNQLYYLDDVDKTPPVLEPFATMEGRIPGYNTLRCHNLVEAAGPMSKQVKLRFRLGKVFYAIHIRRRCLTRRVPGRRI